MIKRFLEAGQIVGTHGVRGEVRVNPWCDSPEFLKDFKKLYWKESEDSAITVSCRPHGNVVLIKLDGIETVEAAAALRNRILYMKRSDAKLPEGSWFIAELIGCRVVDADNQNIFYGTLVDVSQTGANDVWHIKDDSGKEYLLPAIPPVVIETDVESEIIRIKPLKGIFDDAD